LPEPQQMRNEKISRLRLKMFLQIAILLRTWREVWYEFADKVGLETNFLGHSNCFLCLDLFLLPSS